MGPIVRISVFLLFCAGGLLPGGCRESPSDDPSKPSVPSDRAETQGRAPSAWPPTFAGTATPPPAPPPPIPPGTTPTKYADAHVGMSVTLRVTPEKGDPTEQTTEVVRTSVSTVFARQKSQGPYGTHTQRLAYNRYVEAPPARKTSKPPTRKPRPPAQLESVAGKTLLCEMHKEVVHGHVYRTLRCRDLFGWTVQHEDNAAGTWKQRLRLVAFQE